MHEPVPQRPDLEQGQPAFDWMSQAFLTDAGVENHYSHVWLHGFTDLYHLPEEFGFLLVPTRRVHNDHVKAFFLELCNTLCSDGDGVRLRVGAKVGNLRLRRRLTSLVECTGTESIRADDT